MGEFSRVARVVASESVRPDGRVTDQMVGSVAVDLAYHLWPTNTAPEIASRIGCEVRTAERYLGGQRDPAGDKLLTVVVAEIMRRHGARNLKIKAKR